MTLAELEDNLPNGFHDAYIRSVSVDYAHGEVQLGISLSFSLPDDPPEVPGYREATVKVSGLKIFVIDPPNPAPQCSVLDAGDLPANGFVTSTSDYWKNKIDRSLVESAGPEAPLYSFFIGTWNSCIHIAATSATFEWVDKRE